MVVSKSASARRLLTPYGYIALLYPIALIHNSCVGTEPRSLTTSSSLSLYLPITLNTFLGRKNAKSPKRNTDAGAGSLVDDHIEMGRSASVVQSHMRGFIARREMRQRIETKLEEDIDIPDFGFLDALEPMSPMLQQRGVGSDRKSLRK